jgi:hypothetical protein
LPDIHLTGDYYPAYIKNSNTQINNSVNNWTNELNRHFSNEEVQMASRYMKKYSTPLATREMQIQTIWVRFYLKPIRMTIVKKTNNKC